MGHSSRGECRDAIAKYILGRVNHRKVLREDMSKVPYGGGTPHVQAIGGQRCVPTVHRRRNEVGGADAVAIDERPFRPPKRPFSGH